MIIGKPVYVEGREYHRLRLLGDGGYCNTYLARDVEAGYQVTLRELKDGKKEKFGRKLFSNGIKAHRLVNGKGRFPKLQRHSDTKTVLDYIPGKPVHRYLRQPPEIALAVAYQAAECLYHLHGLKPEGVEVVHRDVTPSNLILTPGGEEFLIDLDTVRVSKKDLVDKAIFPPGTNGYGSPEKLQFIPETQQSDLFSLGSVLYQLVTGERPLDFNANLRWEEGLEWFDIAVYQAGVIPARVIILDKRTHISQVIRRCWRINGEYESAEEMLEELADRLKRKGIKSEETADTIASWIGKK